MPFKHKGQLVYALQYSFEGGSGIIAWLDESGHVQGGIARRTDDRPMVSTKPGETLMICDVPRVIAAVEVFRVLPAKD